LLQRLCDAYGDDKENIIKQIMHQEYNNSSNRYKDLTFEYFDNLLKTRFSSVRRSFERKHESPSKSLLASAAFSPRQ